jgi:hypothetical protein
VEFIFLDDPRINNFSAKRKNIWIDLDYKRLNIAFNCYDYLKNMEKLNRINPWGVIKMKTVIYDFDTKNNNIEKCSVKELENYLRNSLTEEYYEFMIIISEKLKKEILFLKSEGINDTWILDLLFLDDIDSFYAHADTEGYEYLIQTLDKAERQEKIFKEI